MLSMVVEGGEVDDVRLGPVGDMTTGEGARTFMY